MTPGPNVICIKSTHKSQFVSITRPTLPLIDPPVLIAKVNQSVMATNAAN